MPAFSFTLEDGIAVVPMQPGISQADWFAMRDRFTQDLLEAGHLRILVDCEAVDDLPSIAYGVFCTVARDVQRLQGRFCLCSACSQIMDVIRRTHIDRMVRICGNRTEARTYLAAGG